MFSDIERAVLNTRIFQMPEKKALDWIKTYHEEISRATYYRIVSKIESNTEKRREKYVLEGVFKKQIDAIDRLEKLISMMFTRIEKCDEEGKYSEATTASNSIGKLQEILTSYYDEIMNIIEYDADMTKEHPQLCSKHAQIEQNLSDFFNTDKNKTL